MVTAMTLRAGLSSLASARACSRLRCGDAVTASLDVLDATGDHRRRHAGRVVNGSTAKEAPGTTESDEESELIGFTSPSGNVGCFIDAHYARCDVMERDWTPPLRPADCEFDYGQGIGLAPGEEPEFMCAGDTALGGGEPLAYGQSISAGVLRCDSAESGITCRDTKSGHGFAIALLGLARRARPPGPARGWASSGGLGTPPRPRACR